MNIRLLSSALALTVTLAGCAQISNTFGQRSGAPSSDRPQVQIDDAPAPPPEEIAEIVSAPEPQAGSTTAAQFDTTTAEQKEAAKAAPTGGESRLGEVTASLGDPTEPGLWIKTPLVGSPQSGRLEYPVAGTSAVVELRPLAGDGGSQVSLAAMRLLEAPLTDLPTLIVYAN